ncbi:hypothetical protein C6376_16315 [Streptomyces sp. P3]|nr:hypothetical protein C6376_16315 [Streptomyces sp. P3]
MARAEGFGCLVGEFGEVVQGGGHRALLHPEAGLVQPYRQVRFTIADAFEPEPFAPFRAWQQHHVTVCAVHLDTAFPSIRVALRGGGGRRIRYALEVETLRPDFAEALVTEKTIEAMLAAEVMEWSIQGRDVLTVLRDEPADTQDGGTGGQPADYDLDAVRVIERLTALIGGLPTDLAPWADDALSGLPLEH